MEQKIGLTIRAAFIADKIALFLSNVLKGETSRDISDQNTSFAESSPVNIIILAYCQGMGTLSHDKFNLFALKKLLAECGYEISISQSELATLVIEMCGETGQIVAVENVESDLSKYAKGSEDSLDILSRNALSLRRLILQVQELGVFYKATEIIKKHSLALKRKRTQLLLCDDYGVHDTRKWNEEKTHFFNKVVLPSIGNKNISDTTFDKVDEFIERVCNDESPQPPLEELSENHHVLTPLDFEARCADVLKHQGWKTRLTKSSGDQGVDIIAERNGLTLVFQCKLHNNPVGNKAVQEVHAGKDFLKADLGIVVSNADFTPSARELAASLNVLLLHHHQLGEIDRTLFINTQRK